MPDFKANQAVLVGKLWHCSYNLLLQQIKGALVLKRPVHDLMWRPVGLQPGKLWLSVCTAGQQQKQTT